MSDSRLSGRSSSGGVPGGGRIIAQNPSLLDMLREKTLEHEQRNDEEEVKTRFYVDSPVFTKEDEENIKFVNPDVEEELEDSLEDDVEPESVNAMPSLNDLVSQTADLKSRQNTNATQFSDSKHGVNNKFDSSRYQDLAARSKYQPPSALKKTTGPDRTWNSLQKGYEREHGPQTAGSDTKSVNFNNNHTEIPSNNKNTDINENTGYTSGTANKDTSLNMSKSEPQIITPIQNPLKPLSKEQTEEMRLLEEEERYQEQLKQRVWETSHEAESVHIPKLDLDEVISDDDDQKRLKKSMVADSLDSSDRSGTHKDDIQLRDSLDYPQNQPANNSHDLQVKYQELQQRLERLESEKAAAPHLQYPQSQNDQRLQNMFESQRSEQTSARRMTSSDLKNLQDPKTRTKYSHEFDYIPEDQFASSDRRNQQQNYQGNMPLNFANEYDAPQQEPNPYNNQQYVIDPQQEQSSGSYGQTNMYDEQAYYAENPENDLPVAPNQQVAYQYQQEQYPEEQFVSEQNNQGYNEPQHVQDFSGYREFPHQESPPGKDYIDLNKRALRGDVGSAKSYGKMFHKKKDIEKHPSPPPVVKKKVKPPGKPIASSTAVQSRTSTSSNTQAPISNARLPATLEEGPEHEVYPEEQEEGGEISAEDRWAQRAHHLAREKSKKLATGNSKSNTPLRKYQSASRLDDMKQQQAKQLNSNNKTQVPKSLQGSAIQRQWQPTPKLPSQQQQRVHPTPPQTNAYAVKSDTYTVVNGSPQHGSPPQQLNRHAVYTDNGQKVDVDINLKMVSPGHHQQRPPLHSPGVIHSNNNVKNQYGAESPMQLQSMSSSASTIRHAPPVNVAMQYGQVGHQQGNQHYNYTIQPQQRASNQPQQHYSYPDEGQEQFEQRFGTPPQHFSQEQQQVYNNHTYRTYPENQPIPGRDFGYGYPVEPNLKPKVPIVDRSKPQRSQPIKAFDNYQGSYSNYNDTYPVQDSYSGLTSPSSFQQYENKSSPTPGNMSPYRVVPPINSAERERKKLPFTQYGPPSNKKHSSYNTPQHKHDGGVTVYTDDSAGGGGSYVEAYEKNKTKKKDSTYKPYTLHDYRNMKKEVRLGGLGPDIESETVKEKREKLQRKLNYAKSINERNREEYEVARTRPRANLTFTKEDEDSEQDMIDKRRLALEYAKSVPKPKVRVDTEEDQENQGPQSAGLRQPKYRYAPGSNTNTMKTTTTLRAYAGQNQQGSNRNDGVQQATALRQVSANTERENEMIDLEALQQRHEQERQKVAMIRQNMQVS